LKSLYLDFKRDQLTSTPVRNEEANSLSSLNVDQVSWSMTAAAVDRVILGRPS